MSKQRLKTRNIVSFYELDEKWQKEAKSNLGDYAEENHYLEPLQSDNPNKHILWDLSECMEINEGDFNACIGISNNSAMYLQIDDCFETAKIKFV